MDRNDTHVAVLRDEVAELLCPASSQILVDCTVGLGGHSRALLEKAPPDAQLIAMDVDQGNLRRAKEGLSEFVGRVRFFHANFSQIALVLSEVGAASADIVLADLGVSSNQLDDPQRGLSFGQDGPLDMRLDDRLTTTAADLVNDLAEAPLADMIYQYGEERYSRRIARAVVAARKQRRIERTAELAEIVRRAYPAPARRSRRGVAPATRTFQALRIAVNQEMENLHRLLELLPNILSVGGRAGIISFHSLEDRPVKQAFADWAASGRARLVTRKPVTPSDSEVRCNSRSRSAKLRVIERIAA
ncbi:MAG: 16S rRNA (cytosine(1402)-N(4))-methyltransferase RsmH [Planctomycetota bacterium]|jgi:16S rRNA (cytosine1402-N4)-methyltransferase